MEYLNCNSDTPVAPTVTGTAVFEISLTEACSFALLFGEFSGLYSPGIDILSRKTGFLDFTEGCSGAAETELVVLIVLQLIENPASTAIARSLFIMTMGLKDVL